MNRAAKWLLPSIVLTVGVVMFASGVLIGVVSYSPTPLGDQWDHLLPRQLAGHLFAPHNEHRIVVPTLVFWADILLARGTGLINLVVLYAFNTASVLALFAFSWKQWPSASWVQRVLALGAAFSVVFSGFQIENFASGFQLAFTGVFFFSTAAVLSLAMSAAKASILPRAGWLVAAIVFATAATGSMANGLIVAIILPLLALLLRMWLSAGVLAILAGILCALYFRDYPAGASSRVVHTLLTNPAGLAADWLAFLGGIIASPLFSHLPSDAAKLLVARLLGAAALFGSIAVAVWAFLGNGKDRLAPGKVGWAGVCGFILASGLVTAAGRGSDGPLVMLSNRYGAATAVLWSSLLVVLVMSVRGRIKLSGVEVALAMVVSLLMLAQPGWLAVAGAYKAQKVEGEAALLGRVEAQEPYRVLYPDPNRPVSMADEMRSGSLAMFAAPWARLVDADLTLSETRTCSGRIGLMSPVAGSLRPTWKVEIAAKLIPGAKAIAITPGTEKVRGLLIRGGSNDPTRVPWRIRQTPVWMGYVTPKSGDPAQIAAYAVNSNGAVVCRVEASFPAGVLIPSGATQADDPGDPIPGPYDIAIEGRFVENGQHPVTGFPVDRRMAWGSWAGDDRNTGRLTMKIAVAGLHRVRIPVVTGPETKGIGLLVRADGVTVLSLASPAPMTSWRDIDLDLPSGAKTLEIDAEDAADNWAGWIAIGSPRSLCAECRR